MVEAEKVYQKAKQQLEVAEEKIKHLDNHQYDPNCKFCCDNEFVKDAMKAKADLEGLQTDADHLLDDVNSILTTLQLLEGVETQYNEWNELKTKYSKGKVILEKSDA